MQSEYKITLEQLLNARDERTRKQKELLEQYRLPLICFTVNMPGMEKNTPLARKIFYEGCSVLLKELKDNVKMPEYEEMQELNTGSEAYLVLNMDEYDLKKITVQIENKHTIGRLWDFDVIGRNGEKVSRVELGFPNRKCFICEKDAFECARSRAHSLEEILEKIQLTVNTYFQDK